MTDQFHHLLESDFQGMERRYRANLLNKISGLKPSNLIGSSDAAGRHNLALFNSVLHIGADPALLGILFRPLTVPRHTHANIMATRSFTINLVTESMFRQAHQCSAKYEEGVSEFEATGLTPLLIDGFPAPFVAECPVRIGLEFEEEHHISANDTRLVIGRVKHLFVPEGSVKPDGDIDLAAWGAVVTGGLDSYYRTERIDVLPYARP